VKDLKFEQKSSLSRVEAADRLAALATALREGGDAELDLGSGTTLSLRVPDDLRAEVEVEVGDGEVELEIEFKWSAGPARSTTSRPAAATEKATTRKKSEPAAPGRRSTGTRRVKNG